MKIEPDLRLRCQIWRGIYTVQGKKEVCRTWRFTVIRDRETGEERLILKEPHLRAFLVANVLKKEVPEGFW